MGCVVVVVLSTISPAYRTHTQGLIFVKCRCSYVFLIQSELLVVLTHSRSFVIFFFLGGTWPGGFDANNIFK